MLYVVGIPQRYHLVDHTANRLVIRSRGS